MQYSASKYVVVSLYNVAVTISVDKAIIDDAFKEWHVHVQDHKTHELASSCHHEPPRAPKASRTTQKDSRGSTTMNSR
jgi:hypothetical protein